jgi:uncharacterized membrane protein YphA (DoxX/SURF4 family)
MHKIPRYINKPLTFVGLELVEVALIFIGIFYCWAAASVIYFFLTTAAIVWFIYKKRNSPHGFYRHVLYFCGLYELDHYPEYSQKEFLE